jgi:hypothetical protein
MAKKKKEEAPKLKYVVREAYIGSLVMSNEGNILLNVDASQKELEYVYNNVVNGAIMIMKVPA